MAKTKKKKVKKDLPELLLTNAEISADLITDFLCGKPVGKDQIKIASQSITQLQRFMATTNRANSLKFSVCKAITENKKELRQLLKRNVPEITPG